MKTKVKSNLKNDEKENQLIENNIKINIDLGDLKPKPEKMLKREQQAQKNRVDIIHHGQNTVKIIKKR